MSSCACGRGIDSVLVLRLVVAAKYNLPLTSTEFSSKDYYVNIRKSLVSGLSASMSASVWG